MAAAKWKYFISQLVDYRFEIPKVYRPLPLFSSIRKLQVSIQINADVDMTGS